VIYLTCTFLLTFRSLFSNMGFSSEAKRVGHPARNAIKFLIGYVSKLAASFDIVVNI